jgi:hypothetical protein
MGRAGLGPDGDLRLTVSSTTAIPGTAAGTDLICYSIGPRVEEEAVTALNSLPSSVRDYLAMGLGLNDGNDNDNYQRTLGYGDNPAWNSLQR